MYAKEQSRIHAFESSRRSEKTYAIAIFCLLCYRSDIFLACTYNVYTIWINIKWKQKNGTVFCAPLDRVCYLNTQFLCASVKCVSYVYLNESSHWNVLRFWFYSYFSDFRFRIYAQSSSSLWSLFVCFPWRRRSSWSLS